MYWIVLILILFLQCSIDLLSGYETIDNSKIRPIAIILDNDGLAEGAPLDSVNLSAYFAGEPVSSVKWFLLKSSLLPDKKEDTVLLENIVLPGTYKEYTGSSADSIKFTVVVPSDFIRQEFLSVQTMASLIPEYMHPVFSKQLLDKNPNEILDIFEVLSINQDAGKSIIDSLLNVWASTEIDKIRVLPALLQIFSVPLKIGANVNANCKMEATFVIRYNKKLQYLGENIPVNRNPQIDRLILYKIKGEVSSIDVSNIDAIYSLSNSTVIQYQKGYSYFLYVERNNPVDTGVTMIGVKGGEKYAYEWFIHDSVGNTVDALITIKGITSRSSIAKLCFPPWPYNRNITVWCVVYDYYLGERLRPVGFAAKRAIAVIGS